MLCISQYSKTEKFECMHDPVRILWRCEAKYDPVVAYIQRIWFNRRLIGHCMLHFYDR